MTYSSIPSSPTLIQSLDNPIAKRVLELHTTKGRQAAQSFMAEGEHLVEMAHAAHFIKELIVLDGFELPLEWRVYPRQWVTEKVMKKISQLVSPSPLIAICTVHPTTSERFAKILVLDGIQDPGNMGTILRTALAFGVSQVVISDASVDVYNDKVVRASQGALFALSLSRQNVPDFIRSKKGFYPILVTGLDQHSVNASTYQFPDQWILVMGNEGAGVTPLVNEQADVRLMIPMSPKIESLNVAIATAILLHRSYITQ